MGDKLINYLIQLINTIIHVIAQLKWNVKSNTYIDSNKEINDKNTKSKIGGNVIIPKYKNVFAKGCTPNCSEEVCLVICY